MRIDDPKVDAMEVGDRLLYIRSAEPDDERSLTSFSLRNVPLLSRVGADRADTLRTDIDAAVAGWADAACCGWIRAIR